MEASVGEGPAEEVEGLDAALLGRAADEAVAVSAHVGVEGGVRGGGCGGGGSRRGGSSGGPVGGGTDDEGDRDALGGGVDDWMG